MLDLITFVFHSAPKFKFLSLGVFFHSSLAAARLLRLLVGISEERRRRREGGFKGGRIFQPVKPLMALLQTAKNQQLLLLAEGGGKLG